jgi:hypothetical protein
MKKMKFLKFFINNFKTKFVQAFSIAFLYNRHLGKKKLKKSIGAKLELRHNFFHKLIAKNEIIIKRINTMHGSFIISNCNGTKR